MKNINITIVTYSWPPKNSIAAHRPYTWAKYWSQKGANVTVLTTRKYSYDAPNDLHLLPLKGVKVLEIDYLEKSNTFLHWLTKNVRIDILKRVYGLMKKKVYFNINPRAKWRAACKPLTEALSKQTDVLISTYDPAECHLIAYDIKKKNPNILWIADYRDLWSLSHVAELNENDRSDIAHLEKNTVGSYADIIITVSNQLANKLELLLNKKVLVVPNGFDLEEDQVAINIFDNKSIPKHHNLKIVYTGKIYPKFQNILPILEALNEMEKDKELIGTRVSIDYYGAQTSYIERIKNKHDSFGFINNYGHVNRESVLDIQKEADLLLLLESPLPDAKGVLTGKVFEYISTGVPIISLGSLEDSAINELLCSTGTGICCQENKSIIKDIIRSIIMNEKLNWFDPNLEEIMKYSRKNQAYTIFNIIEDKIENNL